MLWKASYAPMHCPSRLFHWLKKVYFFGDPVTLADRLLFCHIAPVLGFAIPAVTLAVVNLRISVCLHHSARRGYLRRRSSYGLCRYVAVFSLL